jgi:hypothetical protein
MVEPYWGDSLAVTASKNLGEFGPLMAATAVAVGLIVWLLNDKKRGN